MVFVKSVKFDNMMRMISGIIMKKKLRYTQKTANAKDVKLMAELNFLQNFTLSITIMQLMGYFLVENA